MTLRKDKFLVLRKNAMEERKERVTQCSNSEVTTISEIAEALKKTSMINGKPAVNLIYIYIVGHGRSAALLAGPNPKKRKLNPGLVDPLQAAGEVEIA